MRTVTEIYAHYALSLLATFEEPPPSLDEMLACRRASLDDGRPYLVAETSAEIAGFAYAAGFRARPAYRFTVEHSVYLADGLRDRGVGSALLGGAIQRCEPARGGKCSRSSATAKTPARSACTCDSDSSARAS